MFSYGYFTEPTVVVDVTGFSNFSWAVIVEAFLWPPPHPFMPVNLAERHGATFEPWASELGAGSRAGDARCLVVDTGHQPPGSKRTVRVMKQRIELVCNYRWCLGRAELFPQTNGESSVRNEH